MSKQQDFFSECNDLRVSPEHFASQFCSRCFQRECTRSQFGKSLFESRVLTWEERLFKNPAKLDTADPRFEGIQSKRFLEIYTGPVPEIGRGSSSWMDPRDLGTPEVQGREGPAPVIEEPVQEAPAPSLTPSLPEPVQALPPAVSEPVKPPEPSTTPAKNTPFRQGQMVGGHKPSPKAPAPVYDAWAGPKPASPPDGTKVVKPGARIKLGG